MKFSLAAILAFTTAVSTISAAELADIPTTATDNGDFVTLVAALSAADLVDTLAGPGPFTVFAPNDAAFAKLDSIVVPCLLEPDNKAQLTTLLTYHVASGEVMAADLTNDQKIPTLEGSDVTIRITGTTVTVNDMSQVIAADVAASNGVIHVIDNVLIPPSIDVDEFLVLCRELYPDLDPKAGATADKALEEDKANDGKEVDDGSGASMLSVAASLVGGALVTVFGM